MEPSRSAVLVSGENGDYQRTTGTIHRESLNTGRPRRLTPRFFPVSLNRGLPADFGVTCENAYRDLGDSYPRSGRDGLGARIRGAKRRKRCIFTKNGEPNCTYGGRRTSGGVLPMSKRAEYALERLWEDSEFVLSREVRQDGSAPVLLLAPASDVDFS